MKKFIKNFKNVNEERFNLKLIKHEYEEPLIDFIINIFKSLESTNMIKLLEYEVITDESKINMSRYITSRKAPKSKDKQIKYHHIQYDRCDELIMKFRVEVKGESCTIRKRVLVPKKDENNYFTFRNKKYFLLYQLVDNSTYTGRNSLTLKTAMPACVKREIEDIVDVEGNVYTNPYYFLAIFNRSIEGLLFYLCKLGFDGTLHFFNIDKVVDIILTKPKKNTEDSIFFELNKHMWLQVNRKFFEKYSYIRSMCIMIKRVIDNKTTSDELNYLPYWIEKLGSLYTTSQYKKYDSGTSTIVFFERLLDENTKVKLKLSEINKVSIYSVIKWIIQNFIELKKKNNLDLTNKRLRLNEYVGQLLARRIGDSVNRVLSNGSNIELKQVKDIFKFPATVILQSLHVSPLLKFDDRVNDLDVFSALRYTVRGPQSLGEKSSRNISLKYRGSHPSYIGKLDLNLCSSSNPGLSGACTPFAKTYGLYFSDAKEPELQEYEIMKDVEDMYEAKGYDVVRTTNKGPDEYYKVQNDARNKMKTIKAYILKNPNDIRDYIEVVEPQEKDL